jgi:hypothetical protein
MPKRQKTLAASQLKPGLRFRYNGVDVEILRDRERSQDRFGQALDRWWSKDLGTGKEGYMTLGPTGKLYNVEVLSTRHHAKKATMTGFRVYKREGQHKLPTKAKFDRYADANKFAKKWAAEQRREGYSTGQIVIAGPMAFGEEVIWLGEVPRKQPARPARFHATTKTPMRLDQEIAALTARSQSRSRAPAPKGPFGIYVRSFDGYENVWKYLLGPFKTKRGAEREATNFRTAGKEILVMPISQGGRST